MKKFELVSVEYKNTMSVGDEIIKIDLNSHHKTLITGKNGGGKSTILEAITFALFGKPYRDIVKSQLINSTTKKNQWVKLVVNYDNSVFVIIRGQKPTVLEVTKNGNPITASASVKDFQSEIETMLGLNYNSFKQLVVLGTAGYTPFMGLKKPERRKLVEDLLEVSILANMDKLNKDHIKTINSDIVVIDQKITNIKTQIQTHKDYQEKQKKLSGDNVDRLQKMYDEIVVEVNGYKTKILELNEYILNLNVGSSQDIHEQLGQYQADRNKLNNEKYTIKKVISLYGEGGSCPTCLQILHNDNVISKLHENISTIDDEYTKLESIGLELEKRRDEHIKLSDKVRQAENEIKVLKQSAISQVERAKKIKAAINESKQSYVDNSNEIEKLSNELDKHLDEKTVLLHNKHLKTIIVEMLKDSGIKGSIIKKYIPLFNKQINYYLGLLEADYVFTLDEEFSETIKSRGREDFTYASFSQGEKGRIDLALLFTWRDVAEKVSGISVSSLFMDEVFDSCLDAQGTKNINTIINKMKSNIFIISHRDDLNPSDYGQHLQLKKIGRFTILE